MTWCCKYVMPCSNTTIHCLLIIQKYKQHLLYRTVNTGLEPKNKIFYFTSYSLMQIKCHYPTYVYSKVRRSTCDINKKYQILSARWNFTWVMLKARKGWGRDGIIFLLNKRMWLELILYSEFYGSLQWIN